MLGLLIRSMQVSTAVHRTRFDHVAVLAAYKAHVRSVVEYGCLIWSGAAVTHMRRLERLQHRFLTWLNAKTRPMVPPRLYIGGSDTWRFVYMPRRRLSDVTGSESARARVPLVVFTAAMAA